jgi:hypothetical protein
MRKATILIILVAAGVVYGANDTWKTKPYQQWDKNDVTQILTNSPWVKSTTVTATWKGLNASDYGVQPNQQSQPSQPPTSRPGMGGGGGGSPSGGGQPGSPDEPSMAPSVPFIVRWTSAQTMREALARDAVLNGRSSEAQAQQYVAQQPPSYDVVVYGTDMTPFANETNDTLKSKAFIEVKPSKEKVSPSSVEIVKDADGKKITSVLFSFPKQGPNGQALFAADDKQAQFDCKLKDLHLDTAFDLRKMTGPNGRDL